MWFNWEVPCVCTAALFCWWAHFEVSLCLTSKCGRTSNKSGEINKERSECRSNSSWYLRFWVEQDFVIAPTQWPPTKNALTQRLPFPHKINHIKCSHLHTHSYILIYTTLTASHISSIYFGFLHPLLIKSYFSMTQASIPNFSSSWYDTLPFGKCNTAGVYTSAISTVIRVTAH